MRYWLTCVVWLAALCVPSQAMNWEGHDDWLADTEVGLEYAGRDRADPAPLPPCLPADTALNPYEQVPLPGQNCRAMPATATDPPAE